MWLQVTQANIKLMRRLVENGPERHPGANFIQQRGQAFKKLENLRHSPS